MKLAILVKYVGTSFEGFQAQPSGNTVQQHLTSAVSKVFGFPCNVTGCSRTDSGVHALGFVATVEPSDLEKNDWCTIPPAKFHRAVAQHLPTDIAVIGAATVDDSFHPRYSVSGKEYVYIMKDSPDNDPFLQNRVWQLRRRISDSELQKMQDACKLFIGNHDFRGFMSKGSSVTDTVRTVTDARVIRDGEKIFFSVSADGFLYNMVRIMAGTLVGIAYGEDIDVSYAIENGDRLRLGVTAPPEGLYLNKVFYDPPIVFECE